MSCVLSHPISGQILVVESGSPALLYTSLNDLNINLNTKTKITLKSYSNLYLLESTDSANNIYPTEIGFVLNSGLPNGLGLYNYNTITGKINNTGIWKVATRYIYPNQPEPVSKILTIVSKTSGGSIDSYPLPNFETIFTENGEPVFPINGPNGLEIPTLDSNGNIIFTPITQITTESPFIESNGPTFDDANIPENPESSSSSLSCPEPVECPVPTILINDGSADEEEAERQAAARRFANTWAGGDPINYIALRGLSNLSADTQGIITGFDSFWAESRYLDTRTRTENYFLGRIGNKYVRIDTQTDRGFNDSQLGIIKGIKFSQGLLTPSGNGYLPYGTETASTFYFIITGLLPDGQVASSLIRKNSNGPYIDVIQNGTGLSLGSNFPTGIPRLSGSANFRIQVNVGIENITALSLNWEVFVNSWRSINEAVLGGSYSSTIGDLLSYDQVGGSFINHLNYTYGLIPFNSDAPSQTVFSDLTGIQLNEPWQEWGNELKWTELTPSTRHFHGLSWLLSRSWINSDTGVIDNNIFISGGNFTRNDPGFENFPILMQSLLTLDSPCPPVLLGTCIPCDPTNINFTGDFEDFNNSPDGAVSGVLDSARMTQAFAECLGFEPNWEPPTFSTTSSLMLENLLELIN